MESSHKHYGFTLLELIVVIIILGILATLGFSQYVKMVEKGRTTEAKTVLGQIRTANNTYALEHGGVMADSVDDLLVGAPTACASSHYFSYSVSAGGVIPVIASAVRCTTGDGGKSPDATNSYTVTLDIAAGAWGGDAGYY